MKPFTTKQKGDAGEIICAEYLKRKGFKILERNYRKPFGEIDLIARKGDLLCFVEVKTRHSNPMTCGWEAVDYRKRKRIILTAQAYLAENGDGCYCRFDVCEVTIEKSTLRTLGINYIESAFEL